MPPFHTGGAVIYKGAEEKNRRAYKNARNTAPRIPPFKKTDKRNQEEISFHTIRQFQKEQACRRKIPS